MQKIITILFWTSLGVLIYNVMSMMTGFQPLKYDFFLPTKIVGILTFMVLVTPLLERKIFDYQNFFKSKKANLVQILNTLGLISLLFLQELSVLRETVFGSFIVFFIFWNMIIPHLSEEYNKDILQNGYRRLVYQSIFIILYRYNIWVDAIVVLIITVNIIISFIPQKKDSYGDDFVD